MGLSYKIRQLWDKVLLIGIVGLVAFGGWHFYKKGTFRHGLKPAFSSAVSHIPYFGSRFRHYINSSGRSSYVASKSKHVRRAGKRHHGVKRHRAHRRRR